jgi:penicillin amidase
MAGIHGERTSIPAKLFMEALQKAGGVEGSEEALSVLREWDFRMDRDGIAPTIYSEVRARVLGFLTRRLLGDLAEEALAGAPGTASLLDQIVLKVMAAIQRGDRSLLPAESDRSTVLASALEDALACLREKLGTDVSTWQWGRIHRTRPRHPLSGSYPQHARWLDPPSLPVHGDGDTPLAGGYAPAEGYTTTSVSVNRYIHDPSDWNRSLWIVPLGSSGHPGSPHYADQAERWANVDYIPQLWDWDRIASESESCQRLEPA